MASANTNFDDNYVDIDDLLTSYHRKKKTVLFLIAAIALIFYGTISGYSALQYKTAKVETLYSTTLELATATVTSERCTIYEPNDPVCTKAKEIISDPKKAGTGSYIEPLDVGGGSRLASAFDFKTDPMTQLFAAILTQPLVLRLQ